MPDNPSNSEPSLVLNPVIQLSGIFPGSYGIANTLAQIHFLGTNYVGSANAADVNGALLPISTNTALFSLLGTYFGGDGKWTFALPDLGDRVAMGTSTFHGLGESFGLPNISIVQSKLTASSGGSSEPIDNVQPAATIGWYINLYGIYPSEGSGGSPQMIGAVNLYAGGYVPDGVAPCDGRLLSIAENEALFTIIGTTYGGDGENTFALPDLRDRSPVGAGTNYLGTFYVGEQIGSVSTYLTQSNMLPSMGGSGVPVNNREPGLVLTPLIALQGIFGGFDDYSPTLGEISWFAGNFAPRGYAIAQGQLLPINQNTALFSLLGTTFGGDGRTTFALPDLRGRVVVGDGGSHLLGETFGSSTFTLTDANMPALNIVGDGGNNTLYGGPLGDTIDGAAGNDTIYGNAGADVLKGGPGNDVYYVDNAGDVVTENAGEGTDEVRTTLASYTLTANVENLTGLLATGQTLIGNSLANAIHGGAGHDVLNGGSGDDVMVGGPGDDTYYVGETGDVVVELAGEGSDRIFSKVSYVLPDNVETLQLQLAGLTGTGNALANTLIGSSGADVLRGMGGADLINAADGNDTLEGGADNDTLYGGLGNDVLDGGTGADTMYGQQGDDLYYVDDAGDVVIEGVGEGTDEVRTALASYTLTPNVENLTGTSAGGQALTGNTLANTILGNAGNDVLNGGGGADTMKGALGNDVYYVDDVGDVVSELLGQGTDEVRTTLASYTLANNVENLTGLSGGVQTLAGNGLDNVITGSTNNDVLNGNGGNDTLKGGLGNDTYYVQQVGDVVVELAGEGVDKVLTKVDYTLPDNVEILQLQLAGLTGTGNALDNYMVGTTGSDVLYGMDGVDSIVAQDGNDTVYGGNGNDQIWGGGGNDFIDGGEGADKMAGQLGNDVYVVDDAGDVVIEGVGEGTDEVRTALAAYSLTANVENLTGTSAGGQALTGNTLANIILGNAGNDVLNGGGGADTMKGALGNDVYYVDLAGDVVVENAGEGTDKILAKVSYTLPANVEILQLQLGGLTGTGNGLDNTLTGSTGNDILRGLGGADTMAGGDGADTLEGGADNDALYGGNGNDVLDGGAGDDSLNGGADNDTLKGGAGKDSLFGGTGADTFAFGPGDSAAAWGSADTILDFVSGTDRIDLSLIDANTTGGAPGDQAFTFIGNAAFSNVAGQLHYVQSGGFTYIEGDTNGDAIADFTIQLTGTLNPVVADFML